MECKLINLDLVPVNDTEGNGHDKSDDDDDDDDDDGVVAGPTTPAHIVMGKTIGNQSILIFFELLHPDANQQYENGCIMPSRKNYSYPNLPALFADSYMTSYTLEPIPQTRTRIHLAFDFQIFAESYRYTPPLLPPSMPRATFQASVACAVSEFAQCPHGDADQPDTTVSSLKNPTFFR
jgi:hypothetical protein